MFSNSFSLCSWLLDRKLLFSCPLVLPNHRHLHLELPSRGQVQPAKEKHIDSHPCGPQQCKGGVALRTRTPSENARGSTFIDSHENTTQGLPAPLVTHPLDKVYTLSELYTTVVHWCKQNDWMVNTPGMWPLATVRFPVRPWGCGVGHRLEALVWVSLELRVNVRLPVTLDSTQTYHHHHQPPFPEVTFTSVGAGSYGSMNYLPVFWKW